MFVGGVMFLPRQMVRLANNSSLPAAAFCRQVLFLGAAIVLLSVSLAPAAEESGPVNLLQKSDGLHVQGPPGAVIEPTSSGGLKVTYSIAESPSKSLWLSVKRVFNPSVPGTAVSVEVPSFSGEVLVNVWNDQKNRAFKALKSDDSRVVDLFGLNYRGAKEEFDGKVHAVEIAMQVPKFVGEHIIEIERFELDR